LTLKRNGEPHSWADWSGCDARVATPTKLRIAMWPKAYAAPVDVVVTTRHRLIIAVAVVCITVFVTDHSYARDDGRFANSPLKEWFDRLASKNGLCCTFWCQCAGCGLGRAGWALSCTNSK